MKKSKRYALVLALLGALALCALIESQDTLLRRVDEISYSAFLAEMEEGRVAEIAIRPERNIRGTWADSLNARPFEVDYPTTESADLVEQASKAGVAVRYEGVPFGERYAARLAQLMVVLFYGAVVWLLMTQYGTPGGVAESVDAKGTTFRDVGGTQGAAEELKEVVEFLNRSTEFNRMGARTPKGVLLVGPSGTGKTLMARAVAGEAQVPYYSIAASSVTGFLVGLGAKRLTSVFKEARRTGGVIFIDEIDSLAGRRGANQSHNEDDRTLNQLLILMDGVAGQGDLPLVVIGATNRPEALDEAAKRPGRFDRMIHVGLPTQAGREEILHLHAAKRKVPLAADVDFRRLARLLPGTSGADLENLINEAAIAAVRDRAKQVAWRHFEKARDRILLGRERVGFVPTEEEQRIIAVHEVGHAITGLAHVPEEGLHKITIRARGNALGVAHFAPDGDTCLLSRRHLKGQMVKAMGGRAAEEIVFGADAITSGAASDLDHANRIARRMVEKFGMGEKNGFLVRPDNAGEISLDAMAEMDREIRSMLREAYREAKATLQSNRELLDTLTTRLLEMETMDTSEVTAVVDEMGGLMLAPA